MHSPQHWIVRIAQQAGWPGAATLALPPSLPIADAWAGVITACQVSEQQVLEAVSAATQIPVARWDLAEAHAAVLVPERLSRLRLLFPLRETARQVTIAVADPFDLMAEQEVAFAAGRNVEVELATPTQLQTALDASYADVSAAIEAFGTANRVAEGLVLTAAEEIAVVEVAAADAEAPPIVNLVNTMMNDAVKRRASDIHIEPGRQQGLVRFRIDGVMHEYLTLPMAVLHRCVSRIKILGQMDIADRMRPQDGRARIQFADKSIDLRLSTVPTRDAEKAVIRILDGGTRKTIEEIGFPPRELARIRALQRQRDGIVVVTGPTGSGKTTTLYSALAEIASASVNVVTIEDPVEYDLPGVTQIQVETKRGVTFAGALRAVLRQDPDVILVGEVRDAETAQTAAHAALTGHLVLTTLHTNDAVGVIQRLLDLGLEPGTIGDALRGVIAQRLIRRLCPHCAAPATAPYSVEEDRLRALTGVDPVQRPVGCELCSGTGYLGRIAVPEVIVVSEEIERLIAEGAAIPTVLATARREGLRLLHEVALDAVRDGRSTLDEVERVIGIPELTVVAAPRPADLAGAPAAPASAPHTSPAVSGGSHTVLLVDDDPVVRTVVGAVLRAEGMQVEESEDGFSALQRLLSGAPIPALILLDMQMPGLDGLAVVKQLRQDRRTARLPIIIVTGSEERELEYAVMAAGADDYLNKPVEPARLLARVRAVLRRAEMR